MGATFDPAKTRLANYPFVVTLRPRFGDMDNVGHVNNVAIAALFEEARVAMNHALLGGGDVTLPVEERTFPAVVAHLVIDYLAEVRYPGEYQIGVGVGRVGSTSVLELSGMFDGERCVALCETVLVHRPPTGPAPVPPRLRGLLTTMFFPVPVAVGV
jgi:acyl-CoA thioester hydrolase